MFNKKNKQTQNNQFVFEFTSYGIDTTNPFDC